MDEIFDENQEPEKEEAEHLEDILETEEVPAKKYNVMREIREWLYAIVFGLAVTFVLKMYVFDIVKVEGPSMLPTVVENDRIFLWKLGYTPKPGDIIVLRTDADPKRPYIKRVIAVAGQEVDFRNGGVYVDGVKLEEDYLPDDVKTSVSRNDDYPMVVEEDAVYVLGDNRGVSKDSRSIGQIRDDEVLGKAAFRFLPFSKIGPIKPAVK